MSLSETDITKQTKKDLEVAKNRMIKGEGISHEEVMKKYSLQKKLKGQEAHRLRVGDYRILFFLDSGKIYIAKIWHRQNIYDR